MNQTPPTYRHVPRQQAQEKMHGQASGTSRMTPEQFVSHRRKSASQMMRKWITTS